jgi:hypothetical protein
MKTWMTKFIGCALFAVVAFCHAASTDLHDFKVISLHNGPNEIDLDGDGIKDDIFIAWRGNEDAHGYERITFYRKTINKEHAWELVPFFNRQGKFELDSQRTTLGADCALGVVVVIEANEKNSPVAVLVANRELGKSYADPAHVSFSYYELARNADGIPGWPSIYWKETRTIESMRDYCDVKDALRSELGVSIK